MSDLDFFKPQRQSRIGILLIFFTSVFQLIRNFWVLGVYFFVSEISGRIIFFSILGLALVLVFTLLYSVFSYLKFIFYIDEEKGEFVLKKGVISSEVINISYNKIQQVNFKRNLLQRLIGVYSMVIDTAGSKDKEVEVKALTKLQADMLGALLLKLTDKEKPGEPGETNLFSEPTPVTKESPESSSRTTDWEYKLSFLTLLKLGLTSNYFRGLAILTAFYFSLKEQLRFTEDLLPMPNLYLMEMASTVILVLLLVLTGMVITIGETFVKYYKLKLRKTATGLQLEMGLRENTKVTLKAERVQLLQVLTNPIQRKLDLHKLKIFLASSRDDLNKDKIQIPGLPREIVKRVEIYLYSSEVTEKENIRPHRLVLFRRIFRGLIPLVIAAVILFFSSFEIITEWIGGAAIIYVLTLICFQIYYFRSLRLSVSNDFLVKQSGVWIKKKQIIEMYKLQSVSMSQAIWHKKRELVHLIFHTAGGDVSFKFLNRGEAVALMDHLLYKIESNRKAWM